MKTIDSVQLVPIEDLTPHPQNPRISVREDVVESIRKQIEASGSFPAEHALLVRPLDGGYQIVSGHHRLEAAKRAQLDTVPCWVRPLDDETAFLQLALSNAQGELTPLEIGLHALQGVVIDTKRFQHVRPIVDRDNVGCRYEPVEDRSARV